MIGMPVDSHAVLHYHKRKGTVLFSLVVCIKRTVPFVLSRITTKYYTGNSNAL
jgi:hypothetical protein